MNDTLVCPCDSVIHPRPIFNPPGLAAIAYRGGDWISFRHALLQPLHDQRTLQSVEYALRDWKPSATGDLAVQMVEWWAYLADILTFYNERVANESYLRTALLTPSIQNLVRLLGYRPRPGIGAHGILAVLTNNATSLVIPNGFPVQSKPGPGKSPQLFEVDADTTLNPPNAILVEPPPQPSGFAQGRLLLKGAVNTVKAGDEVLLLHKQWPATNVYALVTVADVQPEKDPQGHINTRVVLAQGLSLSDTAAASYKLLKSAQSAHLWQYRANTVVNDNGNGNGSAHMEAISRGIKVGDPLLFDLPGQASASGAATVKTTTATPLTKIIIGSQRRRMILLRPSSPELVQVSGYSETIWYANAPEPAKPQDPPDPKTTPPVPIPHSVVSFTPAVNSAWDTARDIALLRYAWQEAGQLIETPAATLSVAPTSVTATGPSSLPASFGGPVLLEDAKGNGVNARATLGSDGRTLALSDTPADPVALTPALRLLANLIPVSRGQSVHGEVLGSGNAALAGQEFVLQKSPLTYLLNPVSTSGQNYKSTLRIWVNQIEWYEAPSFFDQPVDAHIFVTREDADNKTNVQFGDGVHGARLPTGVNNVVANYRYGSGAEAPAAGTLTVITQPLPNLKAIRNPVAVGGGADPDPLDQIRRYAPLSVLTLGRAISGDDYEAIAAQTPGVKRAKAYWGFDTAEQRTVVKVYVGDDAQAVQDARIALAGAVDVNRPPRVYLAMPLPVTLSVSLRCNPAYAADPLVAAVRSMLVDPNNGLIGTNRVRIGQSLFNSQIEAACLSVPGVLAAHNLRFTVQRQLRAKLLSTQFLYQPQYRHDPGEGAFFQLDPDKLDITTEGAANG